MQTYEKSQILYKFVSVISKDKYVLIICRFSVELEYVFVQIDFFSLHK